MLSRTTLAIAGADPARLLALRSIRPAYLEEIQMEKKRREYQDFSVNTGIMLGTPPSPKKTAKPVEHVGDVPPSPVNDTPKESGKKFAHKSSGRINLECYLDQLEQTQPLLWSLVLSGELPIQSFTPAISWFYHSGSNNAATPLADFSQMQKLAGGRGADFGAAATAFMNRVTFNMMRNNTNPSDLHGRRSQGWGSINNLQFINQLLAGDDLPQIVVQDEGEVDEKGFFKPYLPNGKVIVFGKRTGDVPPRYQICDRTPVCDSIVILNV